MQKIVIHKLGPVKDCELEIKEFTVFTGPQASGKSTVAKSIFFFKNVKNIVFSQLKKQWVLKNAPADEIMEFSLIKRIEREMRSNFLQIFGSTWHMDMSMYLEYYYTNDNCIKVSLKEVPLSPNYIWIDFGESLANFIKMLDSRMRNYPDFTFQDDEIWKKVTDFFEDDAEIVYIPAGRSMITLLSTQLNYIYSFMNDFQKKNLDYCTQNYLERILQLKQEFTLDIVQMIYNTMLLTDIKVNKELLFSAAELMKDILQGEYRYVEGEERLQISDRQYVKINFASSGQQEVVWILNVIFYYLRNNKKAYFIIEEPESHLFPNAQKLIAEFISLARNNGRNQVFITTHSPYILGTVNNLLYADKISESVKRTALCKIVSEEKWLKFSEISAYFVNQGKVDSCTDDEFGAIENEVIDGASGDSNEDFENMVLLKEKYMSVEEE